MFTRVASIALFACFAVACGGSSSNTPPPDTQATADKPAEPATPPAPAADPANATPAASAAPAESAAPAAAPAAPADPRAAATLTGTILGKPFEAGSACVASVTNNVAYVEIYDKKGDAQNACGMLPKDKGARKIGVSIPWKAGEKVDLAKLLPKGKEPTLFVMERGDDKVVRKDAGKDFKPTGALEIVRVPAAKAGVGRIKITLTSGKDKLEGEVDVEVKSEAP